MELRAYGICRTCSEIYPQAHGCPTCDGDVVAAATVEHARATAYAADGPNRHHAPAPAFRSWHNRMAIAALSLTLLVGTLLAVVLIQA